MPVYIMAAVFCLIVEAVAPTITRAPFIETVASVLERAEKARGQAPVYSSREYRRNARKQSWV